jgi:hypothetical protein
VHCPLVMLRAYNTDFLIGVTQFFENEQDFGASARLGLGLGLGLGD